MPRSCGPRWWLPWRWPSRPGPGATRRRRRNAICAATSTSACARPLRACSSEPPAMSRCCVACVGCSRPRTRSRRTTLRSMSTRWPVAPTSPVCAPSATPRARRPRAARANGPWWRWSHRQSLTRGAAWARTCWPSPCAAARCCRPATRAMRLSPPGCPRHRPTDRVSCSSCRSMPRASRWPMRRSAAPTCRAGCTPASASAT